MFSIHLVKSSSLWKVSSVVFYFILIFKLSLTKYFFMTALFSFLFCSEKSRVFFLRLFPLFCFETHCFFHRCNTVMLGVMSNLLRIKHLVMLSLLKQHGMYSVISASSSITNSLFDDRWSIRKTTRNGLLYFIWLVWHQSFFLINN